MKLLTSEWVDKAEGDFSSALRELRARKSPNYDAACFHAQQCIEKYLKARLQEEAIPILKTHDLARLLGLLLGVERTWSVLRPDCDTLTQYAVQYRYPGSAADRKEAREALRICRELRTRIRASLGLT